MADNYFARKRREREAAQGRTQLTPGDPKLPHETRRAANEAQASEVAPAKASADARRSAAEASIAEAQAPVAGTVAEAEARKAEADARAAQIAADAKAAEQAELNSPEARRAKIAAARTKAKVALQTIEQIRRAVGKPGSSGPVGQIARWVDGTAATDKETAIDSLGGIMGLDKLMEMKAASATGASGMGALSEKEMRVLIDQMGPLSPRQSNEQLLETLRNVEKHFKRFALATSGVDPDQYDALGIDPYEELDPQTARRRAQQMLREGVGEDKVGEFLTIQGLEYDPSALKANVGYQGAKVLPPEDAGPHSFVKGLEHVGSRAVSGAEWLPNTLLGTDFNLGNQWHENLQQRWEGRETDPAAEMTGRIVGALPAAALTRNPFLGGAVENTLVNDSRDPMGVTQDALVGGAAGKLGDLAIRSVAGLVAPNVSQPVRNLHQQGVRMTPGQITGNTQAEGLRTSLPFVGRRIQGSIDQSYDDVQHAMGDQVLNPGGVTANRTIEPGGDFVRHIQQRGSDLYNDALRGTTLAPTNQLGGHIMAALGRTRLRPDIAEQVMGDLEVNLGGLYSNPNITGREWKALDSDLGALAEGYRRQGGSEAAAAPVIRDVRNALFRNLTTQNPGSSARRVRQADQVHRGVRILNNAAARDGANNVPSPGQIMGAIRAEAPMGRTALARGDAPLQGFASDVQNAMPTYANSRSADRAIAALPTTREGVMAHAQGAMLAPLYSQPFQRGFQNMMLRENYTAPAIGNLLRSPGLGGARGVVGSTNARDLLGMDPLELQAMLEEDARLRRGGL